MSADFAPEKKSSNATEAPTSGKTKTVFDLAASLADSLAEDEFDFVNILHAYYNETGVILTAPVGAERYGIPQKDWDDLINRDVVKQALEQRGLPRVKTFDDSPWRNKSLSVAQIMVANFMLDLNDTRSDKKKLQDLGVSTQQWNAWLREPAMMEYMNNYVDHIIKSSGHEADVALLDKVKAGDLASIKYFHEYTGKYRSQSSGGTTVNVGNTGDVERLNAVLSDIVEIIVEEVDDSAVGARIGDRIKQLVAKYQLMDGLTGGVPISSEPAAITMPEVVANRPLTPEMAAINDVQ